MATLHLIVPSSSQIFIEEGKIKSARPDKPQHALNVIVKNAKSYYNNTVALVTNVMCVGTDPTSMSLPVRQHWEVKATFTSHHFYFYFQIVLFDF